MQGLTERQRRLAEALAAGVPPAQAAAQAGYTGSPGTLAVTASVTRRRPHVAALIARLQAQADPDSPNVLADVQRVLREILLDSSAEYRDRIAAASQLARLVGKAAPAPAVAPPRLTIVGGARGPGDE